MPNTTKLTPKLIRNLLPEQDSQQIERLDLSGRGITEVGNLGSCPRLIRLDLSNNSIKDTAWAASCTQLKWLSLASNPVTSLAALQCLSHLQVLNAGHAQLAGGVDVSGLTSLGALIVNDNQITSVSGLGSSLNTLVAKKNAIGDLSTSLQSCSGLQKLSMAHNKLAELGASLTACTGLKELRLNHNRLAKLPPELAENAQLRILDLGDNAVAKVGTVKVLAKLPWLRSLNLRGCPLASSQDYPGCVLRLLPSLEVLDSKRVGDKPQHGRKHASAEGVACAAPDREDGTAAASPSAAHPPEQQPRHAGRAAEGALPRVPGPGAQQPAVLKSAAGQKLGKGVKKKGEKRRRALQGEQHLSAGDDASDVHRSSSAAAILVAADEPPPQPVPVVPVVGVFEAAKPAAAKHKKGGIATGAKAAALLASGLENGLGSWDAPPPAAANEGQPQSGGHAKRRRKNDRSVGP